MYKLSLQELYLSGNITERGQVCPVELAKLPHGGLKPGMCFDRPVMKPEFSHRRERADFPPVGYKSAKKI